MGRRESQPAQPAETFYELTTIGWFEHFFILIFIVLGEGVLPISKKDALAPVVSALLQPKLKNVLARRTL
jgi:hypothetical protein